MPSDLQLQAATRSNIGSMLGIITECHVLWELWIATAYKEKNIAFKKQNKTKQPPPKTHTD